MSRGGRPIERAKRRRPPGRRLLAVRADEIRVGDLLWSDATMRELRVVAVSHELVRADGNLYADPEDPSAPRTMGVVLVVVDELTRRETQRLGAFAPRARVQVVRHVPRTLA